MSYEQKYLKYKQKYLELKKQLEMNGGGETSTNDISVNTESVLNLSETPVEQTGGFLGLFKSNTSEAESVVPQQEAETELNLTETPVVGNEGAQSVNQEVNQKMYTEINLGPESNMKNVLLSDTPTNEQSGGFLGFGGSSPGPAPSSSNAPCPGTQNPVSPDVMSPRPMETVAAERVAAEAAAAEAAAAQAAAAEAAAAEAAAAQAAAAEAAAAEAAAAQAAAAESAAATEAVTTVSANQAGPSGVVESPAQATPATSKYSVGNSEVNNTEDIERLFSQLGGNYTDLVDESSSSIFSTESDLSITLSDDDLLENL